MFNAIAQGKGIVFFLDGLGGSGKTFVYKVLLALVR
jgi:adenylylsulfate kinase-like enzyme